MADVTITQDEAYILTAASCTRSMRISDEIPNSRDACTCVHCLFIAHKAKLRVVLLEWSLKQRKSALLKGGVKSQS
jgi:hypothetical protein